MNTQIGINRDRNHFVRQAILRAFDGYLCFRLDELDEDVRDALEAIGFRISSKRQDLAVLESGLVNFWQEQERCVNGYSDLIDRIAELQEYVRLVLLSQASPGVCLDQIDSIVDLTFSGFREAALQSDLVGLRSQIQHHLALKERQDFAKDYGLNLSDRTLSILELINEPEVANEVKQMLGTGDLVFTKADLANSLMMIADIVEAIDDIDGSKITTTASLTALEVKTAAMIRSSYEDLSLDEPTLSWWSFPYIEGQKAWRFCQGLWWLASLDGQAKMASLSKQVTSAAKRGHNETEFSATCVGNDAVLLNVVKHYLRLEGYRVTPLHRHQDLHALHIAWA